MSSIKRVAGAIERRLTGRHQAYLNDLRNPDHFATEVQALKERYQDDPRDGGEILLIGSSVFRECKTVMHDMPPEYRVKNLGYGGAQYDHLRHDLPALLELFPNPRAIVLHAGNNDIGFSGKSAFIVNRHCQQTIEIAQKLRPSAKVFVQLMFPTPKRWKFWPVMAEANRQMMETCFKLEAIPIEVADGFHSSRGPHKECFQRDGLHLNDKGYRILLGHHRLSYETYL